MYKYEQQLISKFLDRQGNSILKWLPTNILLDRREQLKIKLKTLAYEAQIIRKEERKTFGFIRTKLHEHRVLNVRSEARNAHLAYGFILGVSYTQMEQNPRTKPNWEEIRRLCKKFGPYGYNGPPEGNK